MMWILLLPAFLQALAMVVDEFYFHKKRGLGLWERLGHPLDTLTVFVVYCLALMSEPVFSNQLVFWGLAVFSSIFITKDEFVHNELCPAAEQWLHALLFLVHPVAFVALFVFWKQGDSYTLLWGLEVQTFIKAQILITALFATYQFTYWNWRGLWKAHS